MKNDAQFLTRKEQARLEFEEHFYATWPGTVEKMSYQELDRLNNDKLAEVNASWPETMLVLKHWVLTEMAIRETRGEAI